MHPSRRLGKDTDQRQEAVLLAPPIVRSIHHAAASDPIGYTDTGRSRATTSPTGCARTRARRGLALYAPGTSARSSASPTT